MKKSHFTKLAVFFLAITVYLVSAITAISQAQVTCGAVNRLHCLQLVNPTISGATLTTGAVNGTVGATTPSTGAFTSLTTTLGVTHTRTPAADSATTNNGSKVLLTTPVDTTGTNTHNGYDVAITEGNASGGTNTVNGLKFENVTGDAQNDTNAVNIGTGTTLGTSYAIKIGSGWDLDLSGSSGITESGAITASGGVDGVLGGVTPAAATITTLSASGAATFAAGSSIVAKTSTTATDINPPYDNRILGNPVIKYVYGSCTVAAVNAGTCVPLALGSGRTIAVMGYDIVAAGSAASCTGVLLEDTNGTPVVVSTIAAAALTSGAHNFPGLANNVLGVGFGAGSGLTVSQGLQIKVNGSSCTTTTAFQYAITYTVQ